MRSISALAGIAGMGGERLLHWLRIGLPPAEQALRRAPVVAGTLALALLLASGEALRWVDYRETLISAPMLRSAHVLAGFLLLATLLMRLGSLAMRLLERVAREGAARVLLAHRGWRRPPAAGLLATAWWLAIGALVLSGLERYAVLHHGAGIVPGLSSASWWVLHPALLPYLYTLLLLLGVNRVRLALARALSYLYTP